MHLGILAIALTVFPAVATAGCFAPSPSGEELLEAIVFVEDVDGRPLSDSFVECRTHNSGWTVFGHRTDHDGQTCLYIQESNPSPAEKGIDELGANCRVTDAWGGVVLPDKKGRCHAQAVQQVEDVYRFP